MEVSTSAFKRDGNRRVGRVRTRAEHHVERNIAVGATAVSVVFGFLAWLLDFLCHRLRVEFRVAPDFGRGFHAKFVLVEVQNLLILRVEHIRLLVEGYELRRMIEEMMQHILAELPIASAEMQMLVPDFVDNLRRSDRVVAGNSKKDEFLVLANGEVGELRRPPVLLGDFRRECAGERVGTAKGA